MTFSSPCQCLDHATRLTNAATKLTEYATSVLANHEADTAHVTGGTYPAEEEEDAA